MSDKKDYQTQNEATKQLLKDTQIETFPYFIEYSGLIIRTDEGVFSPKHFDGWKIFNENFPDFYDKTILELGTATGVTALYLAKNGAQKILAVDINKSAVSNAEANRTLNNIVNMEVRYSDLFSEIKNNEKFDIIYWNMPFGFVEENYKHKNVLEKSIFDPGYNILKKFLKEAPSYLTNNGYILIGTGSGANIKKFKEVVSYNHMNLELLTKVDAKEVYYIDFQLYKLK
ncbi:class I SAM-dependent methyltransferase [Patescibacteria group bacterium]|nr:class I SAM-dependent methyltransferase [Patescibacteria group bacterium]MBU1895614.1 class I SAM-dependent methyltransferase [Patescibacteria group bacterium]